MYRDPQFDIGRATRRLLWRLHDNEDGMVSWALLVAVIFFMVLAGLVYNAGNTVNRKIEAQNAADATAYSGSLWAARGMNAVTASNHLIGELAALYVIHHALGGRYLDDSDSENNQPEIEGLNTALDTGYSACQGAPVPAIKPGPVKGIPKSDVNSTIYEAMITLKTEMAIAYGVHFAAYVVYVGAAAIPIAGPIIQAAAVVAMLVAVVAQLKIIQEYVVLKVVEGVADRLAFLKQMIPGFIKAVYGYQWAAYHATPALAKSAAEKAAQRHGAQGCVRGDVTLPSSLSGLLDSLMRIYPSLPVEPEETDDEKRSQMMRATYPWVVHWRTRICTFFKWVCTMSMAESYYRKWTNTYSLQTTTWLRKSDNYDKELTVANYGRPNAQGNGEEGKNIHLYVMLGLNEPNVDKSQEKWNQWDDRQGASSEIEDLFVHMGFARHSPPKVSPSAFYRQENPWGMVALSQSMIYNGNPQQRPAGAPGDGQPQPQVGFDTLNWTAGAVEYVTNADHSSPPRIKLNWQAKLTPVTPEKLAEIYITLLPNPEIERPLRNAGLESLYFNNH